ncbi:MAG: DNA primase [Candidatus Omnitrophica bacterium CG1_02_40_15]|nr:MAG: DNA primase [Candidatus Omnitrophica bacterium CG1_02_40_15]
MAKIPENILNEIQDKCDIVEVISSYIPLKPSGRNFKACCPFHHEKTPSFVVSPDKQIYHCFGCNSGGNVFNFLKEYEKIDFIDAVKMLAEKTGVKLPESRSHGDQDDSLVSTLYSVNDIAANYYSSLLEKLGSSLEPKRYIAKRGLDEAIIKKFRVGYADSSWKALLDYLLARGVKQDIILKAGLVIKGKDSSYYDIFRDRVIFPIFDARDKVIGFGARVMDETLPKYINSPETAVYKKGQHLYGLNFAKAHIKERNFAIITEGYLDVITCHQYGVNNTIASLGTALTTEQIRLLKRYTHNIVMLYDADQAGEMASLRGLDLFLEEDMNVKIATLEKGHDPDSFLRKFGKEKFDEIIKKSKSLFTYKLNILQSRSNNTEPESKAETIREMLSTINRVRNAIIKAEYIKLLAQELSVKEDAVWEELRKVRTHFERRTTNDLSTSFRAGERRNIAKPIDISPAEKILTKLMLEDVNVVRIVRDELKPSDFRNQDIRNIAESLFSINIEDGLIDVSKLINSIEDKVPQNIISFIVNEEVEIRDREKNVCDCIMTIKKENRSILLKDIQTRLYAAQKSGYEEEEKRLVEEFNQLIKRGL